jgi:hypothetical protein
MLDGSGYLDLDKASRWACVSPRTIRRWIDSGLPCFRQTLRSKILIRPADIEAFLTAQQKPQPCLDAIVEATLHDLQQAGGR